MTFKDTHSHILKQSFNKVKVDTNLHIGQKHSCTWANKIHLLTAKNLIQSEAPTTCRRVHIYHSSYSYACTHKSWWRILHYSHFYLCEFLFSIYIIWEAMNWGLNFLMVNFLFKLLLVGYQIILKNHLNLILYFYKISIFIAVILFIWINFCNCSFSSFWLWKRKP